MIILNFQNTTIRIYVILVIGFICFHSCKPEDAPQNPCANVYKANANFTFIEDGWQVYNEAHQIPITNDTVLVGSSVFFNCKQENDYYNWGIVGDTTFHRNTKSFNLSFGNQTHLQVRLIVKKKPNPFCFPGDDEWDTITKTITTINTTIYDPLVGTYKGYEISKPSDIFYVRYTHDSVFASNTDIYWCNGIPKGCNVNIIDGNPYAVGYRLFGFQNPGTFFCGSQSLAGWGYIQPNNTLIIDYSLLDWPHGPNDKPYSQKFIGTKQ